MTDAIPPEAARLFWDADVGTLELERHADYVMERVMTRGSLAAMKWLRGIYSAAQLAEFLQRRGDRLAPRDEAYWRLIAGLPRSDRPGGSRAAWMGP